MACVVDLFTLGAAHYFLRIHSRWTTGRLRIGHPNSDLHSVRFAQPAVSQSSMFSLPIFKGLPGATPTLTATTDSALEKFLHSKNARSTGWHLVVS